MSLSGQQGTNPQIIGRPPFQAGKAGHADLAEQADKLQNGIASLVLSLVETIIDVLERQALRRFTSGSLTEQEVERLGMAFAEMRDRMSKVAGQFGYKPQAIELALRSGQKDIIGLSDSEGHAVSLTDLIDKLIDKEAVLAGDIRIAVAGVDLVTLNLLASIGSVHSNARGDA